MDSLPSALPPRRKSVTLELPAQPAPPSDSTTTPEPRRCSPPPRRPSSVSPRASRRPAEARESPRVSAPSASPPCHAPCVRRPSADSSSPRSSIDTTQDLLVQAVAPPLCRSSSCGSLSSRRTSAASSTPPLGSRGSKEVLTSPQDPPAPGRRASHSSSLHSSPRSSSSASPSKHTADTRATPPSLERRDTSGLFSKPAWEEWQHERGRGVPELKIFFQNAQYAAMAPKPQQLPLSARLPDEIEFYVSTKLHGTVPFPLPAAYPHKKYLHTAETKEGFENAGPMFSLPLDPEHIIGLTWHQIRLHGFHSPLIVHIPVTRHHNRALRPLVTTIHIPSITHLGINQPIVRVPVRSLGLLPGHRRWWLRLKQCLTDNMMLPRHEQPRVKRITYGFELWKAMVEDLVRQLRGSERRKYLALQNTAKRERAAAADSVSNASQTLLARLHSIHSRDDYTATRKHPIGTPYRAPDKSFPRAALEVEGEHHFFFQNIFIAPFAPRPRELKSEKLLPREIHFFIRVNIVEVQYPFPPDVDESYLHTATIVPGLESGGPSLTLLLNPSTVVGLKRSDMARRNSPNPSMQLVLHVPSTDTVNPGVDATSIAFNPECPAQTHASKILPRIVVPVRPKRCTSATDLESRHVDMEIGELKVRLMRGLISSYSEMPPRLATILVWNQWVRFWQEVELPKRHRKLRERTTTMPDKVVIGSPFMERSPSVYGGAHFPRLTYVEKEEELLERGCDAVYLASNYVHARMGRVGLFIIARLLLKVEIEAPKHLSGRPPTRRATQLSNLNGSRSSRNSRRRDVQSLHERGQVLSRTTSNVEKQSEEEQGLSSMWITMLMNHFPKATPQIIPEDAGGKSTGCQCADTPRSCCSDSKQPADAQQSISTPSMNPEGRSDMNSSEDCTSMGSPTLQADNQQANTFGEEQHQCWAKWRAEP